MRSHPLVQGARARTPCWRSRPRHGQLATAAVMGAPRSYRPRRTTATARQGHRRATAGTQPHVQHRRAYHQQSWANGLRLADARTPRPIAADTVTCRAATERPPWQRTVRVAPHRTVCWHIRAHARRRRSRPLQGGCGAGSKQPRADGAVDSHTQHEATSSAASDRAASQQRERR